MTTYNNVILVKFFKHMGGLVWHYRNTITDEKLSIVCHDGSYGGQKGCFEIMAPWLKHDVEGWLGFHDVHKALLKLSKRGRK